MEIRSRPGVDTVALELAAFAAAVRGEMPFPITPGLDAVWGYQPSLATMKLSRGMAASHGTRPWAAMNTSSPPKIT